MSDTNKAINDVFPDRLSVDPSSPYYNARFARDVGIRFKGAEKTNVEEYCISEGWVHVTAGNAKDRYGNSLTIKVHGLVEPYFRTRPSPHAIYRIVLGSEAKKNRSFSYGNRWIASRFAPRNDGGCLIYLSKDAAILPRKLPQTLARQGQDPGPAARGRQRQRRRADRAAGYSNLTRLPKALDGERCAKPSRACIILGIRSRTQLTDGGVRGRRRLIAVGCFSVGTNQVDLDAARRRGIPVFNAPFSNTRSVAELVIGEIVMLLRRIFPRSIAAHEGAGTSRPRTATRCAARRSASSATAISAPSSPTSPRPWACG